MNHFHKKLHHKFCSSLKSVSGGKPITRIFFYKKPFYKKLEAGAT